MGRKRWERRRTRPAAERSPCGQAQGGGSRGRGPAGLCHSKARAARVGEGTFPAFGWKLAPVTHQTAAMLLRLQAEDKCGHRLT